MAKRKNEQNNIEDLQKIFNDLTDKYNSETDEVKKNDLLVELEIAGENLENAKIQLTPVLKKEHAKSIVYHESGKIYDLTLITNKELNNLASQNNWKYLFIENN